MKKLLFIIAVFIIANEAFSQCRCTRLKTDFVEMVLSAAPDVVGGKGVLYYDETDSTVCVLNPDGTSTCFTDTGNVFIGDTSLWYVVSSELAIKAGASVNGIYVINHNDSAASSHVIISEALDNAGNIVTVTVPTSFSSNWTLTLPPDDGSSGQFLQTNGSGVSTWQTVSGTLVELNDSTWYLAYSTDTLFFRLAPAFGLFGLQYNSGATLYVLGDSTYTFTSASTTTIATLNTDSLFRLTAPIHLPNGTAANPSVSFTNSSGVGIFRSASNVLGIATAGTERVTVDAQGDININAGRGVNSAADTDMWAAFYPTDAQQALSGEGAVNVTSYYTAWTTTGADTSTLANGAQIGQHKKVEMIVDAATSIITLTGYTDITFDDVGDYVELLWNGTSWFAIENKGCTLNP